jgi:hypothetical protein
MRFFRLFGRQSADFIDDEMSFPTGPTLWFTAPHAFITIVCKRRGVFNAFFRRCRMRSPIEAGAPASRPFPLEEAQQLMRRPSPEPSGKSSDPKERAEILRQLPSQPNQHLVGHDTKGSPVASPGQPFAIGEEHLEDVERLGRKGLCAREAQVTLRVRGLLRPEPEFLETPKPLLGGSPETEVQEPAMEPVLELDEKMGIVLGVGKLLVAEGALGPVASLKLLVALHPELVGENSGKGKLLPPEEPAGDGGIEDGANREVEIPLEADEIVFGGMEDLLHLGVGKERRQGRQIPEGQRVHEEVALVAGKLDQAHPGGVGEEAVGFRVEGKVALGRQFSSDGDQFVLSGDELRGMHGAFPSIFSCAIKG